MFICTWKHSIVSGLVSFFVSHGKRFARLFCFHCISGIPTYIWRVEFKVEESAFWVLLNLYVCVLSVYVLHRCHGTSSGEVFDRWHRLFNRLSVCTFLLYYELRFDDLYRSHICNIGNIICEEMEK